MSAVLSVQSHVVAGHVGAGAAVPALAADGVEVWALPTVVLSNHAAAPGVQGRALPGAEVAALARGLADSGALGRVEAMLTGYLGSEDAALAAADLALELRRIRPRATLLVDPVLGDDGPGLYLPEAVGRVYLERLLPLAAIAAPNRFELGWLTGLPVEDLAGAAEAARALRALGPEVVHVTSAPAGPDRAGLLTVTGEGAWLSAAPRLPAHFHGAGDFVAARLLAGALAGLSPQASAGAAAAAAHVLAVEAAAAGRDDLPVAAARAAWSAAAPVIPVPL